MKIALIGYGKMGRAVERIAQERGHEIVARIDLTSEDSFSSSKFASADVAIEFTQPDVAISNYRQSWAADVPVVSGTTGWTAELDRLKVEIAEKGATLFWASNFSLGVNIFFEVNKHLARMMNILPQYDVRMKEVHHVHKKDAPSGTAITLAEGVIDNLDRKNGWELGDTGCADKLSIEAVREGEVNGYHSVEYLSGMDIITISHNANTRDGFAYGAVLAAEFLVGKRGFYSMGDLMEILIGK